MLHGNQSSKLAQAFNMIETVYKLANMDDSGMLTALQCPRMLYIKQVLIAVNRLSKEGSAKSVV